MAEELYEVGSMVTYFEGRVSGFPNSLADASDRAPALVARSVQSINQVLSSSSNGFANLGTAAERSATKISSEMNRAGSSVVASVSQMATSTKGVEDGFDRVGFSAANNFGTVNTAATSSLQYINQWGDGISTSVRRFTSDLAPVPASFSAIGSAAQTNAQTASASLQSVSNTASGVGSTVAQAGTQAASGLQAMSGSAQAAIGSVGSLASQIAVNNTNIQTYSNEIAIARTELASLSQRITEATIAGQGNSRETQLLRQQYAQLSATTKGLVAEKGLLVNQGRQLQTALAAETSATRTSTTAQANAGETIKKNTGLMGILNGLTTTSTTQISSAGTAWAGFDSIAQAVARSIGGITVAWSLALTIGGIILSKLLDLNSVSAKNIELTREAIAVESVRLNLQRQQAEVSQDSVQTLNLVAGAQRKVFDAVFLKGITDVIEKQRELLGISGHIIETTEALANVQYQHVTANQAYNTTARISGQVTKEQEETVKSLKAALADLGGTYTEVQGALAQKTLAVIDYQRATGATTEEVIRQAAVFIKDKESLDLLRQALNANYESLKKAAEAASETTNQFERMVIASERLRQMRFNIDIPKFDITGTFEGVEAAVQRTFDAIKVAQQQFTNWNDVIIAITPNLRDVRKELEAYASKNAPNAAAAARLFSEILAAQDPRIRKGIELLKLWGDNAEVFSDHVKKAKLKIEENSPLLTERAIAGSPEAVKTVVDRYVDTVVSRLNDNKDRVGEVGSSVAALFIQRFEQSLGKDKKTKFFDAIIDDLRQSVPELDAQMEKTVGLLRKAAEELGISFGGVGLSMEQMNRSIIDSLRKQVGITDDMWKRMSASQKATLDEGFRAAANIYITQLEKLELKARTAADSLKHAADTAAFAAREVFNEWVNGSITTSEAIERMGGVAHKALGQIVHDYFEVEIAVTSLADQTDLQLKKIKDSFDNNFLLQQDRFESEVRSTIESVIGMYERYGEQLGLTGDDLDRFVNQRVRQVMGEMKDINKATVDDVIKQHERLKVRLPGIWDEVFKDASASTRRNVDDILRIIDLIPGRVGDSLRKTESEFRRWYEMIDRTIRLIERALGEKETEGLLGVISSVTKSIASIFKKSAEETKSQAEVWADQVSKTLGNIGGEAEEDAGAAGAASGQSFADKFLGALPAIAGGLATFFGSRGQGRLAGIAGGAMAGMQIGSIFGGVGAGIGAAAGAIIGGLFGTGVSEEEKRRQEEQKRLEIERIRQELSHGYQELQQAVLETATRAHALLESIIGRARVPKAEIQGFVKDMTRLLRMLVKELATIPKEVTEEIKVISENLLPSAELMAAMPAVFDGINQHMPMAESQARLYVNDWGLLTNLIGELAESTPNKLEKEIRKFSNRLMPAAELLITVSEGVQAVLKTRPVSASQFQNWASSIDVVLVEVGKLEEKFDRYGVRKAGVFAEQATKTFTLLTEGSEAINSVGDIAVITASDLAPFSSGINLIITTVSDLSRSVNGQMVIEAQRFAQGAGASVTFMLETAQGFQELKDIETVIPDTLRAVGEGVKLAIVVLAQVASEVDQKMRDDAEGLATSIGSVFTVVTDAAQAFTAASATRTLYPATMRAIGDGIQLAVVELARVNRSLDTGMVSEANTFSISVGQVVNLIGEAGAAMRSLEGEKFTAQGLIMLIGNIEEATRRTITLAKSIDKNDLNLAVEFAINAQKIFDATAAGISIQKDMAGLEPISISQWENWVLNVQQQTTALSAAVDSTHRGMLLSAEFRSNTDVIKENVIGALSNILATANAAAGYLAGSANFNSLIAPTSFSASTFAPSAPFASTSAPVTNSRSGGNTYYVTVNNYGHVLDDVRFRESVRQVIQDEDRTSTVFSR